MLDGVGLRPHDAHHPFANLELPALEKLGVSSPREHTSPDFVTRVLDANLGVPGLPQSGTGQTTILTGINAAQQLGFHHGPWVSPSLKPLLEHSVFKKAESVRLANYYPQGYLDALGNGKMRLNAIATSALECGARLEDMSGLGIPPMLRAPSERNPHNGDLEFELDLPDSLRTQIQTWARDFMTSSAQIMVFDEWWTDHLGHAMDVGQARAFAERLEIFCAACLEYQTPDTLFLVTSDHGNFEDLRIKTHTRNPVPLAAVGAGALEFEHVSSLSGIAEALRNAIVTHFMAQIRNP
jgi:2,3-bisphosphoglycerate-independent phosphoglycerate mutase